MEQNTKYKKKVKDKIGTKPKRPNKKFNV